MQFEISSQQSFILLAITIAAMLSYLLKKIDLKGAVAGSLLAIVILFCGGTEGLIALFLFFVIGSYASSWKNDQKKHLNLAQENAGKRGISNVLANGGIAAILSAATVFLPTYLAELNMMIVAGFATACSDTLSSEMGNVYGRKYFNIITLNPSIRGIDGAISINGLWFGLLGSFVIALSTFPFHHEYSRVVIITLAGFSGNIFDSILGSTLQQRGFINNNQVNFMATTFGAAMALVFYIL